MNVNFKNCGYLLLCFIIFFATPLESQTPYEIDWKKDPYIMGVGMFSFGVGIYLNSTVKAHTLEDILDLTPDDVNSFDRVSTRNYSKKAAGYSDIVFYSSIALPLFYLTDQKCKSKFSQIAMLYGESLFLTMGLTNLVKFSAERTRPFVYNDDVPNELKIEKNARLSFFSGHTSVSANNYFFMAKIYNDFFPESKLRPLVWAIAATVPAVNGYLRVKAGKHFPTDVITGYLVGATIGVLVPHLHKKKEKVNGLKMDLGLNNVRLRWVFP